MLLLCCVTALFVELGCVTVVLLLCNCCVSVVSVELSFIMLPFVVRFSRAVTQSGALVWLNCDKQMKRSMAIILPQNTLTNVLKLKPSMVNPGCVSVRVCVCECASVSQPLVCTQPGCPSAFSHDASLQG